MSKRASTRAQARTRAKAREAIPQPGVDLLDKAVALLAAVGAALSAYLLYLYLSHSTAAFCSAGSGCDVVRGSRYSSFLGIPVPLVGLLGFAAILAVALTSISRRTKGLALFVLSLAGLTFAGYLTYLEFFVIKAVCPYCVATAATMLGIVVLVFQRRPYVPGFSGRSLAGVVIGVVLAVMLTAGWAYRTHIGNEDVAIQAPFKVGLAQHLTSAGAVMYGAYWCPHCADQKEMFGDAFKYVKYVECDPRGAGGNPALCQAKGIKGFPTWEIGGRMYEGTQSLEKLASLTGYTASPTR